MTDATDPIAAARAMIEPLTGYTPGPWRALDESECYSHDDGNTVSVAIGKRDNHAFALAMHNFSDRIVDANAALIAAAPALRDMVATLADALEAERAKVAAAYEAAAQAVRAVLTNSPTGEWGAEGISMSRAIERAIHTLTPADAQAALDKMLAEARLEGRKIERQAQDAIFRRVNPSFGFALPEPKETNHD